MKNQFISLQLVSTILCLATSAIFTVHAQTAIGGITPDPSAILDVKGTSRGVLFPRMTTSERDAIPGPATGLTVFNTSTRCLEMNLSTSSSPSWERIKCTTCGAYVAAGEWKEFLCFNLGANPDIDPFTPSWELIGDYYQWGYLEVAAPGPTGPDGSIPNDGLPGTWTPAGTAWKTARPAANALQDAIKTDKDPCPDGYRIPTRAQVNGVRNNSLNPQTVVGTWIAGATNYVSGKFFGPGLFLPAAGARSFNNGTLSARNSVGYYWTSTPVNNDSYLLSFNSPSTDNPFGSRLTGASVRCIEE